MSKTITWNIHTSDGRYMGQAKAFAPETAFCQYMIVLGKQITESDIRLETPSTDEHRIIYQSEEFVLSRQQL